MQQQNKVSFATFRVLKGFNIAAVDSALKEAFAKEKPKHSDFFKVIVQSVLHTFQAFK